MWHKIEDKKPGKFKQPLLCAWRPISRHSEWTYQVLIHWPDGVWTDTEENEIESEDMPSYWREFDRPHE